MKKVIIFITLFLSLTTQVLAENRYVTDRISLDIHVGADEKTSVIRSVPSGTELEVLDTEGGFSEIRLKDGIEGWVRSDFVMTEIPATQKYDVLAQQYEKTTQELDKLKIDYTKKNRELQIRRDQLSNATTTIKELKKRKGGKVVADPEIDAMFPGVKRARVTITNNKGQNFTAQVDNAKGSPLNPMSDEEIVSKFRANAGAVISVKQQDKVIDLTWRFDELEKISSYMELLR